MPLFFIIITHGAKPVSASQHSLTSPGEVLASGPRLCSRAPPHPHPCGLPGSGGSDSGSQLQDRLGGDRLPQRLRGAGGKSRKTWRWGLRNKLRQSKRLEAGGERGVKPETKGHGSRSRTGAWGHTKPLSRCASRRGSDGGEPGPGQPSELGAFSKLPFLSSSSSSSSSAAAVIGMSAAWF